MRLKLRLLSFLAILTLVLPGIGWAQTGEGDPDVLARMQQINAELAARGLNIAVEQIEFFTIGAGRPSNRIHQQRFRWVAGDARRLADGSNITYLVDRSDGATASGLTSAQTEAAIDSALNTWQADGCLRKVRLRKRADSGEDPDIFDDYNDNFGNPAGDRAGNPWAINLALPAIDVETVALHETGDSLELGHFGPPPAAVMNPGYAGIRHAPLPTDHAGMCAVWGAWPR
jgi:hypothetical protein